MAKLKVERIGGLAGFGGSNSHLRSTCEIDTDELSENDRDIINNLFNAEKNTEKNIIGDGFKYKISKETTNGAIHIEVNEEAVPDAIKQCIKDEII